MGEKRIEKLKAVLERLKEKHERVAKFHIGNDRDLTERCLMLDIEIARIEVLLLTHQTLVGDGSWAVYSFNADVLDE